MIEKINKNTYYLNNEEVQSNHIEYYVVIMYTDDENNIFDFNLVFYNWDFILLHLHHVWDDSEMKVQSLNSSYYEEERCKQQNYYY